MLAEAIDGKPDVLLLATGSEVSLCIDAYEQLKTEGIKARVVSMPSWELFEQQSQAYRDRVLPPSITARVCVEQASTFGWAEYVGNRTDWNAHFWGFGTAQSIAAQVWVYARSSSSGG